MSKPMGLLVATGLLTLFTASVLTTNVSVPDPSAPTAVTTVETAKTTSR
ncbi:hypothetical protein [Aeromicrobium chenweiae]|nr:hypothetical protein [Aeromicrobium chenweiae]